VSMTAPVGLDMPLREVLDARTAKALAAGLGLHDVEDLLRHYPRRYQVRGELTPIRELAVGEVAAVEAEVVSATSRRLGDAHRGRRSRTLQRVVVTDGVDTLELVFFNQAFRLDKEFQAGQHAYFEGKVVERLYRGHRSIQLLHPKILTQADDVDGGITPVYPAVSAIGSDAIGKAVQAVLDQLGPLEDPLGEDLLRTHGFPPLGEAFRLVHRPHAEADAARARRRFRFEEAYVLQVILARRRSSARGLPATSRRPRPGGLLDAFDARLPFELTKGQREVGDLLLRELAEEHPMHRLLQGEVGSGKTVVAVRAMLAVVDAGGQAVLLAPTEVLAQQHARSVADLLGPLAQRGMLGGAENATRIAVLTGSMGSAARRQALLEVASGDAGIVIGTHALLEEHVQFFDLGLVVVDEQHRFGVEQRAVLATRGAQGRAPHVLVMTATPIPRTVAMTVFGDLETSTLTELPQGRAGIETFVVPAGDERFMRRVWERIREEVAAGRQAYVVCPRISSADDSPDRERGGGRRPPTAVEDLAAQLSAGPLAGLRLEVLHGQLPPEAKEDVMRRFGAGVVDVLVATTVVEVGVDVPNASVMVVVDAEAFGVSQLHQLRGRIGRGEHPSLCLLVTDYEGGPVRDRLDAVAGTLDGFALSEVDLRQRREGDLLGAAQSGRRRSLLLSVLDDVDVIEDARSAAREVVDADPDLADRPGLRRAVARTEAEERSEFLDRS